ncbi:MAG: hypothetical protein JO072_16425 [Parafilimonas sp.]|nr:hypothetical protein [Parafilimonas sp.]
MPTKSKQRQQRQKASQNNPNIRYALRHVKVLTNDIYFIANDDTIYAKEDITYSLNVTTQIDDETNLFDVTVTYELQLKKAAYYKLVVETEFFIDNLKQFIKLNEKNEEEFQHNYFLAFSKLLSLTHARGAQFALNPTGLVSKYFLPLTNFI